MSSNLNNVPVEGATLDGASTTLSKTAVQKARQKAAKALSNAKQRCTNPKGPDYAAYGGSGIMMLFSDTSQLIACLGLPKSKDTLDRIDPAGHYEPGNVRWVSAAVQSANKKASSGNAHLSVNSQVIAAKDAISARENRKVTTVGWVKALRAFNLGHMPFDDAHWLAGQLKCVGVIDANFDFDTVADRANSTPGYAHLPALSLPGARIRIRTMPAVHLPVAEKVQLMGRMGGLENLSADWNVPPSVWHRVSETVTGAGAGLVLHGRPTLSALLAGWIEGACLAMASSIASELSQTAACLPILRVDQMLSELGSPQRWDEIDHRLLDVQVLLIPDFSLDCGAWGDGKSINWWKVEALLQYRLDQGHQTILGVQNLGKIPPAVSEIVLGAFRHMKMPHTKPHDCDDIEFSAMSYGVPTGSLALRDIRADDVLYRLAHCDNSNKP